MVVWQLEPEALNKVDSEEEDLLAGQTFSHTESFALKFKILIVKIKTVVCKAMKILKAGVYQR